MTNSNNRNRIKSIANAKNNPVVKPTVGPRCEPCADLKYTPAFAESIMSVHKLTAAQVPGWFHQRGHSIFPK